MKWRAGVVIKINHNAPGLASDGGVLGGRIDGYRQDENRPLEMKSTNAFVAWRAEPQLATKTARGATGNRQAHPGAAVQAGGRTIFLVKRFKNPALGLGSNARSAIGHGHFKMPALKAPQRNPNAPAFGGEFDGVVEQLARRSKKPIVVSNGREIIFGDVHSQTQIVPVPALGKGTQGPFNGRTKIVMLARKAHFPDFEPGNIKEVVDDAPQAGNTILDRTERLALGRLERAQLLVQQQANIPHDRCHWRRQLVGDISVKRGPSDFAVAQPVVGLHQLGHLLFEAGNNPLALFPQPRVALRRLGLALTLKIGLDSRRKALGRNRFLQKAGTAYRQARVAVALGGNGHDGNSLERVLCAQAQRHLKTIQPRNVEIHQHQIGLRAARQTNPSHSVGGFQHFVPSASKQFANQQPVRRIILDVNNAGHVQNMVLPQPRMSDEQQRPQGGNREETNSDASDHGERKSDAGQAHAVADPTGASPSTSEAAAEDLRESGAASSEPHEETMSAGEKPCRPKQSYVLAAISGLLAAWAFPGGAQAGYGLIQLPLQLLGLSDAPSAKQSSPIAQEWAGLGLWPLALFAFVPLLIALRNQSPKMAVKLGLFSGFIEVMTGFYWLTTMLQTFSGFPTPVCLLFASIVSLYQAGCFAFFAWCYARMTQRNGYHHGLALLVAFPVSELLWPLLFPWHYGAAFHDVPLLLQTADLGGSLMVTLLLFSSSVGLAEIWRKLRKRSFDRRTVLAVAAIWLSALSYGALRMKQVDAAMQAADSVQIGLVQANIGLRNRSRASRDSLRISRDLRKRGAELLVWSEAAIARPFNVKDYRMRLERGITRRLGGVPAVLGGVLYERMPNPDPKGRKIRLFNSALMSDAKGRVTGRFDKQKLLMFGEYLPLGETFPILYRWSPNSGNFSPGKSFKPLIYRDKAGKERRIAAMICYEDIIPSFVRKLMAEGNPDLLVNLTNDRWFGDSAEPWQHYALAKLRTVEQRRYLARVSNSGVSGLIDANGRVVAQGGTFRQQGILGQGRFLQLNTVYNRVGNIPWWLLAAAALAACFRPRKSKSARS